jgi:putative spermidine/putrescine transport system ATP-binding protein/spermidine/putrescine transport system ATP-binding protein
VADFLGHSNFMAATVKTRKNGNYEVELADGSTCLASPVGEFEVGEKAEIVIRAQKMTLGYKKDFSKEEGMNYFFGKIKDRSYMGGEVSYFIEIADGQLLHVINFVKRSPYRRGDEVYIRVDPFHCRLLKQ